MFYPGGGRPKGALNHATRELKRQWHEIFSRGDYLANALQRIMDGKAPGLEVYLHQMVYGKPTENVDLRLGRIEDQDGLSTLSMEDLTLRAMNVVKELQDAREAEVQLAEYAAQHPDITTTPEPQPAPAPLTLVRTARSDSDV